MRVARGPYGKVLMPDIPGYGLLSSLSIDDYDPSYLIKKRVTGALHLRIGSARPGLAALFRCPIPGRTVARCRTARERPNLPGLIFEKTNYKERLCCF